MMIVDKIKEIYNSMSKTVKTGIVVGTMCLGIGYTSARIMHEETLSDSSMLRKAAKGGPLLIYDADGDGNVEGYFPGIGPKEFEERFMPLIRYLPEATPEEINLRQLTDDESYSSRR